MKVPAIGSAVVLVQQRIVNGKRVPVEVAATVVGYDRSADHDPDKDGQPKLHLVYFDENQANRLDGLDYLDAFPRAFSIYHKAVDSTGHFFWYDAIGELQAKGDKALAEEKKLQTFLLKNFKKETGNETASACAIRLLTKSLKD